MSPDFVIQRACDDLIRLHDVHTILLYGSRADGSATSDSDYDMAGFAPVDKQQRDARQIDGVFLDLFIYPDSELGNPSEDFLKLRGSHVLLQRGRAADLFLAKLDEVYERGPKKLADDEAQAIRNWVMKMAGRSQRGDAEGNYRRAWLLCALLEDYFRLQTLWYLGPKKALSWLQEFDPAAFTAFSEALMPNATHESILALASLVANKGVA